MNFDYQVTGRNLNYYSCWFIYNHPLLYSPFLVMITREPVEDDSDVFDYYVQELNTEFVFRIDQQTAVDAVMQYTVDDDFEEFEQKLFPVTDCFTLENKALIKTFSEQNHQFFETISSDWSILPTAMFKIPSADGPIYLSKYEYMVTTFAQEVLAMAFNTVITRLINEKYSPVS